MVAFASRQPRFGAVFFTNFSVIWICLSLILQIVSDGANMWFIRHDDIIQYQHGGLWYICMGNIDRTFCSPIKNAPAWLQVSQMFILLATGLTLVHIVYIMVAMARKCLRLSVMTGLSNFTALFLFISVLTYSLNGFSKKEDAASTFFVAWITFAVQLVGSALCFYSFLLISKLDEKRVVEFGLKM